MNCSLNASQRAVLFQNVLRRFCQSREMSEYQVKHDKKHQTFYIKLEGKDKAILEYNVISPTHLDYVHTEVPTSYRGKGIAAHLAKAAFDYAVEENMKMILSCSYLQKFASTLTDTKYREHIE